MDQSTHVSSKNSREPITHIITIDAGNSKTHYGLFDIKTCHGQLASVEECFRYRTNAKVILSSVNQKYLPPFDIDHNVENFFRPPEKHDHPYPLKFFGMPVHYEQTLGHDRLVFAYFVYQHLLKTQRSSNEKNIMRQMLIDVGTFITIDFVSKENGFEGGYILPGIDLVSSSYEKGSLLFRANFLSDLSSSNEGLRTEVLKFPQKTQDAMDYGLTLIYKNFFENIQKDHSSGIEGIFLTGGQRHLVKNYLPHDLVKESHFFIHRGLFEIALKLI